ncbi:serine hydrolase domain-containing protein [Antribacter gilvus]|uniref:serine hydrolase domain-containing protein n=1 Tax=Antribacter gilvus TaxID=2304675 RepID=UPI000F785187|nr:serine hydrolase domain-containing protein [Antribacter gilvus]
MEAAAGRVVGSGTSRALDAHLDALRLRSRVPALSAAVGRGGRVVWSRVAAAPGAVVGDDGAGGPVRGPVRGPVAAGAFGSGAAPGLAFRIGSITKPMIAVAVLRLVEAGRVGLSDPMGRHVPDAPVPGATLRHYLTHTSGLPAEPAGPWWERHGGCSWDDLVAMRLPALWEPGERYHYSNTGYAVLGRLVEQAHGRSWDEVLRDELWAPLGMASTARTPAGARAVGYAVHPHTDLVLREPVPGYLAMGPAGEVWSTPADLVRFGAWLVGVGPAEVDPTVADGVLSLAARRSLAVPRVVVDDDGPAGGPWTTSHGLGVRVRQDGPLRTVGHGGSVPGFTADLRADVATGDVVAVCGSSTGGFGNGAGFLRLLQDLEPPLPALLDPVEEVWDPALTGTWYWGPSPYTLSVDAAGRVVLRSSSDGGRGSVFAPVADGTWVGVEGGYWLGERLRVVRSEGGAVALDAGTFHLSRTPYDPATRPPGALDGTAWMGLPSAL